ncbi:MAG: AAA family ATPase [Planctomycetes bacterium]|nr:AAA family ATPase [Planctomycetota bacterium]
MCPEDLRWTCDPGIFPFRTTAEIKPSARVIGQAKALRALKLGLRLKSPGYNIFICGMPGTGRKYTLRHLLKKVRQPSFPLEDLVYLPRFDAPQRPRLVRLPAGKGRVLKNDIRRVFTRIQRLREKVKENLRLNAIKRYLLDRVPALEDRHGYQPLLARYFESLAREFVNREGDLTEEDYGVQVLVSRRAGQRPPVVWPSQVTFSGLFGSFEKQRGDDKKSSGIPVGGIRPGALVEALGGFLILPANELLDVPHAWNALKHCLMNNRMDLFDYDTHTLAASAEGRPDPVPLNVKVILIGDYDSYDSFFENDPEFQRVFKVRVDFDVEVPLTRKVLTRDYPQVISRICNGEKLNHLTARAAAKVVEFGVRKAGRKSKISIQFSQIADLIREASFWTRQARRRWITDKDIERVLKENIERLNLFETKLSEMIAEGVILIDTTGSRVGQVNGLAVYDTGDYQFGKPSRITAETSMGRSGIINIERESGLSGRSHDKGIQILGGYLRSRFAQKRPLSLTASVCFEQSYSGVDGDSASATEIYALLSSLSGLPIRQDIAVTGSLNQKGDIQPIGGVNEKIEGFFDCVSAGRPTYKEGVIIPRRNLPDLMLREDVVKAVEQERFSIFAIDTVEEGIEILTGLPAGERRKNGQFPENTVFCRVDKRLDEIAEGLKKYPGTED